MHIPKPVESMGQEWGAKVLKFLLGSFGKYRI